MFNKDKEVKNYIIEQCKAGVSRKDIALCLAKAGHTNRRGKPVTPQDVSYYASKWGHPKSRTNGKPRLKKPEAFKAGNILKDVEDIITSSLSNDLKTRLLRNLIVSE